MSKVLKAKYSEEKKVFEIQMPNGELLEVGSSGLFDNDRELMAWAHQNGGKTLGYIDGSEKNEYVLVYGGKSYAVEAENV